MNEARLLADIGGHIGRRRNRQGAHWTAEQHRAWKAANADKVRESNLRYRAKRKWLDQLRMHLARRFYDLHPGDFMRAVGEFRP